MLRGGSATGFTQHSRLLKQARKSGPLWPGICVKYFLLFPQKRRQTNTVKHGQTIKKFKLFLKHFGEQTQATPTRTRFISGLTFRVMKLPFLSLKMMVESGLEFSILKFHWPNLPRKAELVWQISRYL